MKDERARHHVNYVEHVDHVRFGMKRNLTVQLDEETIAKARVLAARRSTSVSKLVTQEIEKLVGQDDAYKRAKAVALEHLRKGFHLGGDALPDRDALHER